MLNVRRADKRIASLLEWHAAAVSGIRTALYTPKKSGLGGSEEARKL